MVFRTPAERREQAKAREAKKEMAAERKDTREGEKKRGGEEKTARGAIHATRCQDDHSFFFGGGKMKIERERCPEHARAAEVRVSFETPDDLGEYGVRTFIDNMPVGRTFEEAAEAALRPAGEGGR